MSTHINKHTFCQSAHENWVQKTFFLSCFYKNKFLNIYLVNQRIFDRSKEIIELAQYEHIFIYLFLL